MRDSSALHGRWVRVPRDESSYTEYLHRCRGRRFDSLLITRRAGAALVGVVNFSQIVHGNLGCAHLEFYAVAGQTGEGLMREAVCRAVSYAFRSHRLHRLEAYVQPANHRSRKLLRHCGFRFEGVARRFLKIGGRWLDHERWVMLREDLSVQR